MNKLRSLSLATILLSSTYYANAQDVSDALRYSYLNPQGTARSMGIGNAEGSVGGDFSSLSINPAGIGIYRSSELTITPSVRINSVNGQYLNNSTNTSSSQFNFNNAGVVFTSAKMGRRYKHSKWKSVSFGIGVNRLADFNTDYNYSGTNYTSSATQSYAADATTNRDVEQPGTPGYLGYQAYLTNYDSVNNKYTSIVDPSKGVGQQRIVNQSGGINEIVFTLGGNYMEKLMLGATVGVPIIDYNRTVQYSETAAPGAGGDFQDYQYNENLTTTGAGINLKLGAIYKFSDYFRIGAAVHSPTYYSMHDQDNTNINSSVTGVGETYVPTTVNNFDYGMTTPWRGILSATGFLGKFGFITADYEYVDYSTTRFHYGGDYLAAETAVNQEIQNTLKAASNLRIGVEGRITKIFSLRLGFDYYGNPYKTGVDGNVDGSSIAFTGGLGFRFTHWFVDAGFIHTQYKTGELPYSEFSSVAVPTATLQNSLNTAAVTIGFKF